MTPIYVILFLCGSVIGYAAHKFLYVPWREERRYRRVNRQVLAMSARRLEQERARRAAMKNGRSERKANKANRRKRRSVIPDLTDYIDEHQSDDAPEFRSVNRDPLGNLKFRRY